MIAGIDIGISKQTVVCKMNMAGKVEGFIYIEGSPGKVINALPKEEFKVLAWEEPYHNKNVAVTKRLAEFSGGLEQLATFVGHESFMKIRPVDWQQPLKKSFGVKRPSGMTDNHWFDHRMRVYERIVKTLLCRGVRLSTKKIVLHDQIAAALIAWHVQRKYKEQLLGV